MLAHGMLAHAWPEFSIDEEEALSLAEGYVNWRRHYPSTLDPAMRDMWALVMVVLVIEAPRMGRVINRRKHERKEAQAQAGRAGPGGTVIQMDGRTMPPSHPV